MVLLEDGWWSERVGRDFEGEGLGEFYKDSGESRGFWRSVILGMRKW